MNDIVDELKLLIINECVPLALSNLSLVDKKYYNLLHENSVLMLLSIRHDFKFESFSEYQLFCEIKYLVPQASRHYDMEWYYKVINESKLLPDIDEIIERVRPLGGTVYNNYDVSLILIFECLYKEGAHITGNLEPNDPKIKELLKLTNRIIIEMEYLEYLIKHCPDTGIVSQYWNEYGCFLIGDDEEDNMYLFRGLLFECLSSPYCIERLNWIHSINLDRSHEKYSYISVRHPYTIHYIVNNQTNKRLSFDLRGMISGEFNDIIKLIEMGNSYKYAERIDKLVQKMKW